jgi:hypothetical protein
MYGPANVTTVVMLGFALWVIFTRFRNRLDNPWPIVFYPVLVLFAMELPDRVDTDLVIAGLVAALVLRFEFVAGFIAYVVKAVDILALAGIAYNLFQSSMY